MASATHAFKLDYGTRDSQRYNIIFCDSRYCSTPTNTVDEFVGPSVIQDAWQLCSSQNYDMSALNDRFMEMADSDLKLLASMPLPIPEIQKTSIGKYCLGILPSEYGGFAVYHEEMDDPNEDANDGGKQSDKVSVPSVAALQAKLVSTHIRLHDESNQPDNFANTSMRDKGTEQAQQNSEPATTSKSSLQQLLREADIQMLKCLSWTTFYTSCLRETCLRQIGTN